MARHFNDILPGKVDVRMFKASGFVGGIYPNRRMNPVFVEMVD
jgi:hypothetical protein